MTDESEFVFLVPDVAPQPTRRTKEADVGRVRDLIRGTKEVGLSREQIAKFWRDKVVGLTETIGEAQKQHETEGFRVEEISFSIGVGARGGVMFVAEGSLEATLSVKLQRVG
jgi:hypothetical protein